eukprot:424561-Rhodomonas_salina.2
MPPLPEHSHASAPKGWRELIELRSQRISLDRAACELPGSQTLAVHLSLQPAEFKLEGGGGGARTREQGFVVDFARTRSLGGGHGRSRAGGERCRRSNLKSLACHCIRRSG